MNKEILQNRKLLFIGNSYTFYGNTVIHKGYTVLTRERRDNDPGYFFQLCRENGVTVSVTNWTFGSHNLTDFFGENGCDAHRDCHGQRHQDLLEDGVFDFVCLQPWLEPKYEGDICEHVRPAVEFFRKRNPNVQFLLLIPHMAHEKKFVWLPDAPKLKALGFRICDWGRLLYDISEGKTAVPGAAYPCSRSSFVNSKDNHHENPLTGYITTLMTYCVITGEKALGQPYGFCFDKELHKKFDLPAFKEANYPNGGETNFIEIFHSPADMAGLQQLVDQYK